MTTVTSRFDQHALEALPSRALFVERLRARSFDAFEALPIPSQETEEWRYTDLEGSTSTCSRSPRRAAVPRP